MLYRTSRYIFHHVFKDRMIDILYRAPSRKYFFIVTDITKGTFEITDTLKTKFEWDFVDCFVSGEDIILVHSNGIKNKFFITSKKGTEKILTDILKVEFPDEYEKNNLGDYSETGTEANMVLPGMNLWIPPHLINSNKLTLRSGKDLRIIVNDKKFNTWLISVDLLQYTSQVKKYSCSGYKENYKRAFISSWSTDSTLIRGFHWKDSIILLFDNIYQPGEPQKIILSKDNFDKLVGSGIVKTGNFWSKSNIEQSGFREFIKKCSTGRLVITGYENKGTLHLTLSTKYDLITATVLGNIFTLGMMEFRQVDAPSTISFDLTYNLRDKSTGPGPVNNMEWEKMLMFLWANRSFILSWNLNFFDDYYYLGYYASHVKKVFVHRFRKQLENN
ncbi:MAG: hypothetical protein HOP10_05030 [Chitinophagaceae bacterium]|nr:hypothetical protein [Chitinophagaceae bacterium]